VGERFFLLYLVETGFEATVSYPIGTGFINKGKVAET
jgi:hypothetical protein